MTNKELAMWLTTWFHSTAGMENRWRRDPVGKVIKAELKALHQWKSQPRGNPAKGKQVQLYGRTE